MKNIYKVRVCWTDSVDLDTLRAVCRFYGYSLDEIGVKAAMQNYREFMRNAASAEFESVFYDAQDDPED